MIVYLPFYGKQLFIIVTLVLYSYAYAQDDYIYVNAKRLKQVKEHLQQEDTCYLNAYQELLTNAKEALSFKVNPPTNKSQVPPSHDKHDYFSIAPYWWPNPNSFDGLPWVLKDGEINPMYFGDDFDYARIIKMFDTLENLWMAYYFSREKQYALKAKDILEVWFLNEATKLNPNVNFGQSIPGKTDGRRAGIIEFLNIAHVITTIQILSQDAFFTTLELEKLRNWMKAYYYWLKTNTMGIENDNGLQNHATCYDFQMVGLAIFLGKNVEARQRLEDAKSKRIAIQIAPNGIQPKEVGRTRSVHYSSENLLVMSKLADMGLALGIDLWNYVSSDGRSMKEAFEFLKPYAEGNVEWPYQEIGGVTTIIDKELKPLFAIAQSIFGEALIARLLM